MTTKKKSTVAALKKDLAALRTALKELNRRKRGRTPKQKAATNRMLTAKREKDLLELEHLRDVRNGVARTFHEADASRPAGALYNPKQQELRNILTEIEQDIYKLEKRVLTKAEWAERRAAFSRSFSHMVD